MINTSSNCCESDIGYNKMGGASAPPYGKRFLRFDVAKSAFWLKEKFILDKNFLVSWRKSQKIFSSLVLKFRHDEGFDEKKHAIQSVVQISQLNVSEGSIPTILWISAFTRS